MLGGLLKLDVQAQDDAFTGHRIGVLEHSQHATLGIGFDFLVTDMAVQLRLVEFFDPGLADGLGTSILDRIQDLGLFLVDPSDVADRMSEVLAQRIMAHELRLDIEARQAELVDRQYRDLLFGQFIEQRHRHERMPCLFHRLVELRAVFSRQVQQVDHLVQLLIDIGRAFASDGQVVAGPVVRQDHAIAVIDQAHG